MTDEEQEKQFIDYWAKRFTREYPDFAKALVGLIEGKYTYEQALKIAQLDKP